MTSYEQVLWRQWEEETPFQQVETFSRTSLREGGHLLQPAEGEGTKTGVEERETGIL